MTNPSDRARLKATADSLLRGVMESHHKTLDAHALVNALTPVDLTVEGSDGALRAAKDYREIVTMEWVQCANALREFVSQLIEGDHA